MFNSNRFYSAKIFAIALVQIICCLASSAGPQPEMTWEQLNTAIDKHPTDPQLWLTRGQILAKTFEDKEAIDNYTKALKLDPKLVKAYICRGDSYYSYQKTSEALADYQQAQTLLKAQGDSTSGTYSSLQSSLARCYKLLKQYDKELPLRLALAKNSKVVPDVTSLAECQEANHLPKDAAASYQRAITLEPNRAKLYRHYGDFLVTTGDYEKAAQVYGQGIDIISKQRAFEVAGERVLYEKRAKCYDKLGKPALAVQDRRRDQKYNENLIDNIPTFDSRSKSR